MLNNAKMSWLPLSLLLVSTACAPVRPSGMWPSPADVESTKVEPARGDRNLITTTEILPAMRSAYDVVKLRRPGWLVSHGMYARMDGTIQGPIVYLDGVRYGNCEELKTIDAFAVGEVRYLNGLDATTKFGPGHGTGAILVSLRRR